MAPKNLQFSSSGKMKSNQVYHRFNGIRHLNYKIMVFKEATKLSCIDIVDVEINSLLQ